MYLSFKCTFPGTKIIKKSLTYDNIISRKYSIVSLVQKKQRNKTTLVYDQSQTCFCFYL